MLYNRRRWRRHFRYSLAGLASFALVAGLTMAATPASAQVIPDGTAGTASVEQQVWDELAADGTTTFWVYMHAQADLSATSGIADRDAQGWFVYEQLTQTAEASQAGLVRLLDEAGVSYRSFWIANTVQVTGDADLLKRIAAVPAVSQVTADRTYELVEPQAGSDEPRINNVEWGVARVNAPDVWSEFGITGEDIVVATIDTGVEHTHPALVEQYRGNLGGGEFDHNYNWHDPSNICGNPSLVPCDNNGHGTHVTGTILGDDGGDNQIGVAPGAQWIAAKGCESGSCSTAALLSSGEFITAPTDLQGENPDPAMRPHIVNNSWGGGATSDPWYQPTVQAWVAAGIFPQFAAGNPGSACGQAGNPGNLPESYAAGAFDINDNIASFSGRGPSAFGDDIIKPNLSAPGVNVRSSLPGGGYGNFSGTSMASPHVAGVVALMWSAAVAIERDIDTTRELLDMSAEDTEDLTCGGTAENNNVWGQGKLDAFEAVDLSPRGPTGLLTGTVTDADSGDPISGAQVSIVGEVERDRTTDADGNYSITLPIGDYTVSVTAFGYIGDSADVTIEEDQTHTVNFALDLADSATVSGHVTDGSGHGWALYAQVTVIGTGVSTFTDPLTGAYSVTLPEQASYTLRFDAEYPGYAVHTTQIDLGDSDLTVDASIEVDNCAAAPGYGFDGNVGIIGDFQDHLANFLDSRGIPSTAIGFSDDPSDYDAIIVHRPTLPGPDAFNQFLADTDAAGTGVIFLDNWSAGGIWMLWQYTDLISTRSQAFSGAIPYLYYEVAEDHPIFDGLGGVGDEIEFEGSSDFRTHSWFGGYAGDVIGHAGRADTGVVGPGIGVQERDNNRHALLSLHGVETWVNPGHWTAEAGDLFVNAVEWVVDGATFECFLIDGGLVLGNVYNANTGDGVNGATVTSDGEPADRGTTRATPDDPNVDDGFYWLFSSLTGEHDFTADANNHNPVTQTVDVTASATSEANFTLPAGHLVIDPTEVEATVQMGDSAERSFTITNTGSGVAEVELTERRGGFDLLAPHLMAPGSVTFADPMPLGPSSVLSAQGAPVSEPANEVSAWESGPGAPAGIVRYAHAQCADEPEQFYVISGVSNGAIVNSAWRFDAETQEWETLASIPTGSEAPAAACYEGRIHVMGGSNAPNGHFVYDIASDSWSAAAPVNRNTAGAAAAAFDGKVYLVGGDANFFPGDGVDDEVSVYDIATGSWSFGTSMPEGAAMAGAAQVGELLYVVGGWHQGSPGSNLNATQVYDMSSDTWEVGPEFTNPKADYALSASGSALYAIGGDNSGGGFFDASATVYRLDLGDWPGGSWEQIDDSLPAPRTANQAGFCTTAITGGESWSVGGLDASFVWHNDAFYRETGEGCGGAVDLPWLEVSPDTATLQPGESLTVTVSMDSSAEGVDQPGAYMAGINIASDTPQRLDPVGVTMVVTPPRHWGKITGTVTGVTCDGVGVALAGAQVQIQSGGPGGGTTVHLETDGDGKYAWWMDARGRQDMIVSKDGYAAQFRSTNLRSGQTTVENFTLMALC